MKKATFFFFISGIIVGTSLLCGVWGPRHLAGSSPREECQRLLKAYTSALHAIEENYAEPIQRDKIVYESIQTMLEKLDPHSVFLDPLNRGAGLWLTTARYFTPSGRLIQRDYQHQSLRDYYRQSGSAPLVLPEGCS